MDKWGWFFGWVGVMALVFAVPMAVAGNLLTPKVSGWWATTSTKRKQRRIAEIKEKIAVYTAHPLSTEQRLDYLARGLYSFSLGCLKLVFIAMVVGSAMAGYTTTFFSGPSIFVTLAQSRTLAGRIIRIAEYLVLTGYLLLLFRTLVNAAENITYAMFNFEMVSPRMTTNTLRDLQAELKRLGATPEEIGEG